MEQAVKGLKKQVESFDITKPDETLHLAVDLSKFIKENKLFQNIQGKEYVNVEGWQYAGSRLGIMPVVEDVVSIGDEAEYKYLAKVKLLNLRNDQTVGAGFAVCSNKEPGKKFYQEYAIASMAQTRAIGKAYRNILAWIIRAAGYEPTPAEEMEVHVDALESRINTYINSQGAKNEPAEKLRAKVTEEPAAEVKGATVKQKEQIIKLLNHPMITAEEKNKMLLSMNSISEDRAKQSIAKLKKTIEDREKASNTAAA